MKRAMFIGETITSKIKSDLSLRRGMTGWAEKACESESKIDITPYVNLENVWYFFYPDDGSFGQWVVMEEVIKLTKF